MPMKILVAVDFSDATQQVVAQAKRLAQAFSAKLLLLHSVEAPPDPGLLAYEPDLLFGGIEPDPRDHPGDPGGALSARARTAAADQPGDPRRRHRLHRPAGAGQERAR